MEEEQGRLGRRFYELGLRLGQLGTVAIGSAGGPLALALARIAGGAAALAGGEVRFHDGGCAACAAWLGRYYALPASLFLRQSGGALAFWVLDGRGRLFDPPDRSPIPPRRAGEWDMLVGADQAWAAARSADSGGSAVLSAQGPVGLILALERMGCSLVAPRPGVPLLRSDREGFSLTLEVNGRTSSLPGEDALAAAASWLGRRERRPAASPAPRLV